MRDPKRTPAQRLAEAEARGGDAELWEFAALLAEHRGQSDTAAISNAVEAIVSLARCHATWMAGLFTWSSEDPHVEYRAATGNPSREDHYARLVRIHRAVYKPRKQ